ncbi:biliverdin-producing heme oxygenase [Sphingobium mellinum]|uniref:biliverdin-producing heme oxygenase n=1 Tax=Sphingobium mellinum TaxID=1387166 RepID=UPI0030EED309
MANHQRVDELFSCFSLDSASGYAAFLQAHARALAPLEAIARPESPRLPHLAQDLAALGRGLPDPLVLPRQDTDGFRWGALYALEGSRLGGAMLERRVAPGLPRAYLSSVHDRGGWVAFQQSLDRAAEEGGETWVDDAIKGAEAAFALFATAAATEQAADHG